MGKRFVGNQENQENQGDQGDQAFVVNQDDQEFVGNQGSDGNRSDQGLVGNQGDDTALISAEIQNIYKKTFRFKNKLIQCKLHGHYGLGRASSTIMG